MVQTVGLADWVSLPNPHASCRNPVVIHVSQPRGDPRVATRGRPAPCAELARCVRRRPRVAIAGSNRGETLGGGPVDVSISIR